MKKLLTVVILTGSLALTARTETDAPRLDLRCVAPPSPGLPLSSAAPASPRRPKKRLGRSVLEFFGVMAFSQTNYWVRYSDWIEDWQFELTWEDQSKRFFSLDALRFDSNCFRLNWTHALSGAMYYNIARSNHLNQWESFIFGVLTSMYWEYIVEWREVISVNDNLLNIFGGFPIGETWFQIGRALHHSPKPLHRVLSFINPIFKFNAWLDRKRNDPAPPPPGWQRFGLSIGARNAPSGESRNWGGFAELNMKIVTVPEYGTDRNVNRAVGHTLFSELRIGAAMGRAGTGEIDAYARSVYLGHFWQKRKAGQAGWAWMLGLGSAFTLTKKEGVAFYDSCGVEYNDGQDLHLEEPRNFRDKYTIVHVAGPVLDATLFAGPLRARLTLDATLDFAMMNALALGAYSAIHDISGVKTTLLYYGYYYGFGASASAAFTLDYRNLFLEVRASLHHASSIEGLDRVQDTLTDDFHLRDRRWRTTMRLGVALPGTPARIFVSQDLRGGAGWIGEIDRRERETRWMVGLDLQF